MGLAELQREQARYVRRRRRLARLLLVLVLVAGLLVLNTLANQSFGVTVYQVQSGRVTDGFRIVLLSDLHNQEYGSGNYDLVEEIRQSQPDLILMVGDMVNEDDSDIHVVVDLCENLKRIAPIYYILGNHEGMLMYAQDGNGVALDNRLFQVGVPVIYRENLETVVQGNPVTLGGFSCSAAEAERITEDDVQQFEQSEGFRIVLSHFPSIFYERLYDVDADLAVAGHYHGGQIRLPFVGGLYHMDDGFFPRYSGGCYQLGKAELVVSRGLGGHGSLPRINNPPELVLIDVQPEAGEG